MSRSELQPWKGTRFASWLFLLPIVILLPTSLTFLVMEYQLAAVSGGYDSPEFIDAAIRWGMSGGLNIFAMLTVLGSVLWLVALALWIGLAAKDGKAHWGKALALLFGLLSHMWVLGAIWEGVRPNGGAR